MKVNKTILCILGAVFILGMVAFPANAESDETGDLWHWYATGETWDWGGYSDTDHPNIDITDVSYTKEGLELTLSLTVSGEIQTTSDYMYMVYSGDPGETYYYISYTGGVGIWGAVGVDGVAGGLITDGISTDGSTFSHTFTMLEDAEISPYANAIQYETFGDTLTSEWWQDWYPNTYFTGGTTTDTDTDDDDDTSGDEASDDDTSGDDDDSGGIGEDSSGGNGDDSSKTPGFEIITLIAAISIALILLRKRK